MQSTKETYRNWLHSAKTQIPLFLEAWWLDAVCRDGTDWGVALTTTPEGRPRGAMPYAFDRFWGGCRLRMPPLTPFTGPLLFYPRGLGDRAAVYAFQKKALGELIDQLPDFRFFSQRFFPALSTNGLPFYWAGFRLSTYYTYLLPPAPDESSAWAQMAGVNRKIIRRAERALRVEVSEDTDQFYAIMERSYGLQNLAVPFSRDLLNGVDQVLRERSRRRILLARGTDGTPPAALYLAWDDHTLYTLAIGRNGDRYVDGAYEMLLWEAIKLGVEWGKEVNLCGSSTPRFERKLRLFGGVLTPYLLVEKSGNRWIEAWRALKRFG